MTNISQLWEPLLFAFFVCVVLHCLTMVVCKVLPYEEKLWILLRTVWDETTVLTWKDGFLIGFNMFIICSLVRVSCAYALRFFTSPFLVESIPLVFGAVADFIMLLFGLLALLRKKYWYAMGILVGFFLVTEAVGLFLKFMK